MQNLSSTIINKIRAGLACSINIAVTTKSAETFTLTEDDLILDSFTLNRSSVAGESIEIGNADSAEVKFKINNTLGTYSSYAFEGASIVIDVTADTQTLRLGKFIIDNKPSHTKIFSITALDYMVKFNRKYVSSLGETATLKAMLEECCSVCGVTLLLYQNDPALAYVGNVPTDQTTYHEVIIWIAQLCGRNAYIDEQGNLRLGWYGEQQKNQSLTESTLPATLPFKLGVTNTVISIGPEDRFEESYEASEGDIQITGIKFDDGIHDPITVGTDTYCLEINHNPLVNYNDITSIFTEVLNRVGSTVYRPCKMKICPYPNLWAMDAITVTPPDNGDSYSSVITNITLTLNGSCEIQASGLSSIESGYASSSPFTAQQSSSIKQSSRTEATEVFAELINTLTLVAQIVTNDQTDPLCWARVGEIAINGAQRLGLFLYHKNFSSTVPVLKIVLGTGGDFYLLNATDKAILDYQGAGLSLILRDYTGQARFTASPSNTVLYSPNGVNMLYVNDTNAYKSISGVVTTV